MFDVLPARRGEVVFPAPSLSSSPDAMRLIYVPTSPVFPYCTGIYKKYLDEKVLVKIIAQTENTLMTLGCFLQPAGTVISRILLVMFSSSIILVAFLFHCRKASWKMLKFLECIT